MYCISLPVRMWNHQLPSQHVWTPTCCSASPMSRLSDSNMERSDQVEQQRENIFNSNIYERFLSFTWVGDEKWVVSGRREWEKGGGVKEGVVVAGFNRWTDGLLLCFTALQPSQDCSLLPRRQQSSFRSLMLIRACQTSGLLKKGSERKVSVLYYNYFTCLNHSLFFFLLLLLFLEIRHQHNMIQRKLHLRFINWNQDAGRCLFM